MQQCAQYRVWQTFVPVFQPSGVLKRSTNAMIVQTSDIYKMGKYLHDTSVNLPSYCTFCVMIV